MKRKLLGIYVCILLVSTSFSATGFIIPSKSLLSSSNIDTNPNYQTITPKAPGYCPYPNPDLFIPQIYSPKEIVG